MKQKKSYMKTNNTRFLVMLQIGSCQNNCLIINSVLNNYV